MKDHVSIIISHYSQSDDFSEPNEWRSKWLRSCVQSLVEHTNYPAELIVIDNGGTNDDSDYLVDLARRGEINTYVRNKNNMHFGWAWNQGVKLATGKYIFLTCNDLIFYPNWLKKTIEPLLKYPEKKWTATPMIVNHKYDLEKFEGFRQNTWAGSNCRLLTKELFYEIGEYSTHHLAGSLWERELIKKGYVAVAPFTNFADEYGKKYRLNPHKQIQVKKVLLDGSTVDYSHPYDIPVTNAGFYV